MVVATDSIKNLVLRESASWTGSTLESLLHHLGGLLLGDTPRCSRCGCTATRSGSTRPARAECCWRARRATTPRPTCGWSARATGCGSPTSPGARRAMDLLKLTGSAFTAFVRDGYTTLPDRRDRPLRVGLDVAWRYTVPADALGAEPERYVAGEQVRDVCADVFDGFVSESIQHLVHEMGMRLLERFPELAEVSFEGRNLTRDPVVGGRLHRPLPGPRDHHPHDAPLRWRPPHHPRARHRPRAPGRRGRRHAAARGQGGRQAVTNADGRTDVPLLEGADLVAGVYELTFAVGDYFTGDEGFLDEVPVRFTVRPAPADLHVPLLVSPWSYTTYRGS